MAPDPYHWILNSCFGAFHNVWGAFRTISLLHETRCKSSRTNAINAKVRATKSRRNFSQWRHPIHTIGSQTHVLVCFVMFGVHLHNFITAQNSMHIGSNWCKKCKHSCNEVASEFFAKKAPDHYHWILNSCSGAFRNVWVHLDHLVTVWNSVQIGLNWCN